MLNELAQSWPTRSGNTSKAKTRAAIAQRLVNAVALHRCRRERKIGASPLLFLGFSDKSSLFFLRSWLTGRFLLNAHLGTQSE